MEDFVIRDNFTLMRSVFDSLMAYKPEMCQELLGMIGRYAMDGKVPDKPGDAFAAFLAIRPTIDYQLGKVKAGKKGGETKQKNLQEKKTDIAEASTEVAEASTEVAETYQNLPKGKSKKEKDIYIKEKKEQKEKSQTEPYQYSEVISYLNEKTGKHFSDKSRDSRSLIKARFDQDFTLQDFYTVIDNMVAKWKGDPKMDDYLRPATLFSTKFESYLNVRQIHEKRNVGTKWNPEHQREYDFDALERGLLNASKEN